LQTLSPWDANFLIPTLNLGERILIAPQIWDADTPQVGVGAAEDDVDIVTLDNFEIMPAAPEPPRKSSKDRKKKKRKRVAQRDADGRLVIWLKEAGPAQTAEAVGDEGRPDQTAEILESLIVHSAEDGGILATDVASVQEMEAPIPGTDEVRPTDEIEPVEEMVDAPAPMTKD
jgi:hypothetical protein